MLGLVEAAIILLITGLGVGFASGLLGVGGCFIMIPVQYFVYTSMGIDAATATMVAFGTNLLVVFPTAASGAHAHSKKGFVWWKAAVVLGITGAIGAVIGSGIAALTPKYILRVIFGLAVIAGAIRMLTAKPRRRQAESPLIIRCYGLCGVLRWESSRA